MTAVNILHLTDIHFGQGGSSVIWPKVRSELLRDVVYLAESTGTPVSLVVMTGDIAFAGRESEYGEATEFFYELAEKLKTGDSDYPMFAFVPGNHDVGRPGDASPASILLESRMDDQTDSMLFPTAGGNAATELGVFARSLFNAYANWTGAPTVDLAVSDYVGNLPGDFTATFEKDGLRIGILGLNSAYTHLSDRAMPGSIHLSGRQIQAAAGGDVTKWLDTHDVNLLATHHPTSWLADDGPLRELVFSHPRFGLHLCGHLHAERYAMDMLGAATSHVTHQGTSLVGLERDGDRIDRVHGYALISLTKTDSVIECQIYPRSAVPGAQHTWQIERCPNFGLRRGEQATDPISLVREEFPPPHERNVVPKESQSVSGLDESDKPELLPIPLPDDTRRAVVAALSTGASTAIVGDRACYSGVAPSDEPPVQLLRRALVGVLQIAADDAAVLSTDDLVAVAAARDSKQTQLLVAEYLGNPLAEEISEMERFYAAPWGCVIYLSPLADFREVDEHKVPFRTQYIDTSGEPVRLPSIGSAVRLRFARSTPARGVAELRLTRPAASTGNRAFERWGDLADQRIATSPTFFFSDDSTELNLLEWMRRREGSPQYMPHAFYVAPHASASIRILLERLRILWVPLDFRQFLQEFLSPQLEHVAAAKRALLAGQQRLTDKVTTVTRSMQTRGSGDRTYLLGREPTWGDIMDGFAAPLSWLGALTDFVQRSDAGSVILVEGTAGSGKSSLLMQLGAQLSAESNRIVWVDSTSRPSPADLRAHVGALVPDYVLIDDVDVYGAAVPSLCRDLTDAMRPHGGRLIVTTRSVRLELFGDLSKYALFTLTDIDPSDAGDLISLLRLHDAVADRRLSDSQLLTLLTDVASGQLLVGMIQATSGVLFSDRISSECKQLDASDLAVYSYIALATSELESMTTDQVLAAGGQAPAKTWASLQRLVRQGLVRKDEQVGRFAVRHRVVAEEVRSYVHQMSGIKFAVQGCLWAFAASAATITSHSDPDRRAMVRFLNHTFLLHTIGLSETEIRETYDLVEPLLAKDYHYWLQRGSFELEGGSLVGAMHDLTVAATLPGGRDSAMVLTEYSYARLLVADTKSSAHSNDAAGAAFEDLLRVIRLNGTVSPHTYVVLARHGVPWLLRTQMSGELRTRLATEALNLLETGRGLDAVNPRVSESRQPAIETLRKLLG